MNLLRNESSPYLLQHAENPVHWRPWGEEAWQAARERQQLVVVSVGYSACHWCHVMEREVFEDAGAADVMNAHFVSVKVDREEHPEVDGIYMTAVQLMTRSGGWPLNVVCLPDGRPVWGATYVQREQWEASLMELVRLWRSDRSAVEAYAERLAAGVHAVEAPSEAGEERAKWPAAIAAGLAAWKPHWDLLHGGNAGAPKFPMPVQGRWLATQGPRDPDCAAHARRSILGVVRGGLHDHAGGGFERYAVDEAWRIPHFEKMLSDQGPMLAWLAASLDIPGLTEAERDELTLAATRLVDGVCRDFDAPGGGFYTAWDADSEGQEGRFYWWTAAECAEALKGPNFDAAMQHFDWTERARVDEFAAGAFVPMRPVRAEGVAPGVPAMLDAVHAARLATRRPPLRDEKVVAAHTAWMAWGLLKAGAAWDRPEWTDRGLAACTFLAEGMARGEGLYRVWQAGNCRIAGTLEDHAASIAASLEAYLATGDPDWAHLAARWTRHVLTEFSDARTPLFRFAPPSDTAFAERFDRVDDVLPSANAVMAGNLLALGAIFGEPAWLERAQALVSAAAAGFEELPSACKWAEVAGQIHSPFIELVVTGSASEIAAALPALRRSVGTFGMVVPLPYPADDVPLTAHRYHPELRIYPCISGACALPLDALEAAQRHIASLLMERS